MNVERLVVAFSIVTVLAAIGYAASAAIAAEPDRARAVHAHVAPPATPRVLAGRLAHLHQRLGDARAAIDALVAQLASHDDAHVDAIRVRLGVLYRLESGLEADLARTRGRLASAGE